MNRQLDERVERRIRMWVLDQELERRRSAAQQAPAPRDQQHRPG